MDTYTTVLAEGHSLDSAAALRWAARFAARTDHRLRVVCPVGVDSRELARIETDASGATEMRREAAQRWVVDQLGEYLEPLTVRIETPDQCTRRAVATAARGSSVLVVGSAVDMSHLDAPELTVVQVWAHGRARRRHACRPKVSA